jgi:GntR family galactonate operon transcriptional repressor
MYDVSMSVTVSPVDHKDRPHRTDTAKGAGGSRSEILISQLIDRIISGVYPPGDTIPTEAQLGDAFGVSRTVVREAIKVLAEKQLVRVDRGRGTVVRPRGEWRMLDAANLSAQIRHGDREVVIRELIVMRKGIEPELAALAATSATPEAIASIGACVDALGRLVDDEPGYHIADGRFHEAIAEAAGVTIAVEFLRVMREPLDLGRQLTDLIPEAIASAHQHHLEVFTAIAQQDAVGARSAMRRHLEWAEERLEMALDPKRAK